MSRIGLILLLHDDRSYLAALTTFNAAHSSFAFVSRTPWHGETGDWDAAAEVARQTGAEVVLGDWHF